MKPHPLTVSAHVRVVRGAVERASTEDDKSVVLLSLNTDCEDGNTELELEQAMRLNSVGN